MDGKIGMSQRKIMKTVIALEKKKNNTGRASSSHTVYQS